MTGPKRLIEDGTAFDRALLRAGREDRPSSDYERRVIAAAVFGTASAAGGALVQPSLIARLLRPQYLAIVALGAGAAALTSSAIERGAHPTATSLAAASSLAPELASTAATEPREASPTVAVPTSEQAEEQDIAPVITPDALPTAPPSAAPRAVGAALPVTPRAATAPGAGVAKAAADDVTAPATGASLQREVELLDAVKQSLRDGDPAAAERALDAYDTEFPAGTLKPEAGFLRIRSLLARGERARAVALGDEILARHPNSVHAKRIRAVLAPPKEGAADPGATHAPPR